MPSPEYNPFKLKNKLKLTPQDILLQFCTILHINLHILTIFDNFYIMITLVPWPFGSDIYPVVIHDTRIINNKINTKIQWSPVCDASDEWRNENLQSVTFHYDVHHLNFVYIFFYLTECNKNSGAHQLISGSHKNKKIFKHLIGSVKQTKENLEKDYSKKDFVTIEGKAGHGFIEDTSCFHRALIPINNARLALQFRYY